jgi:oxygen-independent coproporphyrinogen-3 oxidase
MPFLDFLRNKIRKPLTGQQSVVMENKVPGYEELETKFHDIDKIGLYLHIPFCRQICPYCPYNKEIYHPDAAGSYTLAVKKEIDFYSKLLGNKPVTSFYIGGGTPTTMLYSGLDKILEHIYKSFNMKCDIHMESHPNDLSSENLNIIKSLNVKYLSTGVEALEDRYLQFLKRPYNSKTVKAAVGRTIAKGFKCFNADFIFALPGQSYSDIVKAGHELINMGVDQIAAYPLFLFSYTKLGREMKGRNYNLLDIIKRRKMLGILEDIFYGQNYKRTSVWAFTRTNIAKYCSVTVPMYIGLGASGGTYLKDIFYLNTFNVAEYIRKLAHGEMPIALSLDLSERMQMAWWFYWRVYETRFKREDFKERFGKKFNEIYGKYINFFSFLDLVKKDDGNEIIFSDKGIFWLHTFEDFFSLDYISKLWGTSKAEPWPQKVVL